MCVRQEGQLYVSAPPENIASALLLEKSASRITHALPLRPRVVTTEIRAICNDVLAADAGFIAAPDSSSAVWLPTARADPTP